jgi:hypothetical protein
LAQLVHDGEPRGVELGRARRAALPRDAVRLLDERDREVPGLGGVSRGHEVRRPDAAGRAVAEDDGRRGVLDLVEMDSSDAVRGINSGLHASGWCQRDTDEFPRSVRS